MADLATALVSGAFVGAAGAARFKYAFDRRAYDRDNLRRKTESAIRHLRALAVLIDPVQAGQLAPEAAYARQSYLEHLEDARAECAGLDMYGTRRVRSQAGTVLASLSKPVISNPCGITDPAEANKVAEELRQAAKRLTEDWRSDERRS